MTLHPTMKIKILFLLVLVLAIDLRADTNGTPVYFSLRQLTGLANATRFALVPDARQNPVTDGTNLFGSFPIITNAPGGVRTIYLQPIGYTLSVPGWSRSLHLVIPDTTNTVNAVNCITNGLPTLNSATVWGLQTVAVSNSATVTWSGNGTSTNPLVATVPDVLTNGVASISLGSATPELRFQDVQYGHVFRFSVYGNTFYFSDDGTPARVTFGSFMAHGGDVQSDSGNLIALSFIGDGSNLTFTNANGARFTLIVNANTNGFTFVPVP